MLDHPEKTARLTTAMKAALSFDVELTSSTTAYLCAQHIVDDVKPKQTVSKVFYAGDEGGILCHILAEITEKAIVISLTHLRMHRSNPISAAVFDYQKHRGEEAEEARQPREPIIVAMASMLAVSSTARAV